MRIFAQESKGYFAFNFFSFNFLSIEKIVREMNKVLDIPRANFFESSSLQMQFKFMSLIGTINIICFFFWKEESVYTYNTPYSHTYSAKYT